jgi:hypothetical protein
MSQQPMTPTIAKDSVQVTAFTFNVYKENFKVWGWVPRMEFRVNGPVASGSQLYAEFTIPSRVICDFPHIRGWEVGQERLED